MADAADLLGDFVKKSRPPRGMYRNMEGSDINSLVEMIGFGGFLWCWLNLFLGMMMLGVLVIARVGTILKYTVHERVSIIRELMMCFGSWRLLPRVLRYCHTFL